MFFIHLRVGRIPVLPALAAAGSLIIVGSIVVTMAVTTLAIAGVVACGTRLLRALGLVGAEPPLAFQGDDAIEGVVVNRSSAGMLDP